MRWRHCYNAANDQLWTISISTANLPAQCSCFMAVGAAEQCSSATGSKQSSNRCSSSSSSRSLLRWRVSEWSIVHNPLVNSELHVSTSFSKLRHSVKWMWYSVVIDRYSDTAHLLLQQGSHHSERLIVQAWLVIVFTESILLKFTADNWLPHEVQYT